MHKTKWKDKISNNRQSIWLPPWTLESYRNESQGEFKSATSTRVTKTKHSKLGLHLKVQSKVSRLRSEKQCETKQMEGQASYTVGD